VPPTSDCATRCAEDGKHQADEQHDDADAPQSGELGQKHSENQQDDA
jgi:hypothetical protein